MNDKLNPIPAGKPGVQLEIPFKESQKQTPVTDKQTSLPTTHPVPTNQKGTFQSFRL